MNKFLHLQILIVALFIGAIMCQQYNNQQNQHQGYGAQSHFYLHQNHPTPTTIATPAHITPQPSYHHQQPQQNANGNANQHFQNQFAYQSPTPTPTSSFMDLDRFNQQAKAFKDQINYFNQQQSKNLRNQINSVHQDGSEPHFDFIVNQNYSDLEKASEQFVNLGNMAAKQNMPKVIKITKTVAVKQPVPIPYPVPVVKVVKEQVPVEQHHIAHHHYQHQHSTPATFTMTTEKTYDFKPSPYYSNYTSYIGKYVPQQHSHHENSNNNVVSHSTPSPTPTAMATAHKIAESYIKQEFFSTPASLASIGEYDTRPFYVKTSEKEMIKYIPVPYYVDEHGNRHEVSGASGSSSSESSSSGELNNNSYESYYKQPSSDNHSGKFQSFTFSYHPPHSTQATPSYHHEQHSYSTAQPDTKYYYSQGDVASVPISSSADNSVSPSHHYAVSEVDAEDDGSSEHTYQYKYVYER